MGSYQEPFDRADFYFQFGVRVRQVRNLRGMSQVTLARRVGCVPQTISNIERSFTESSLTFMFTIAEVLEVHPRLLMFGIEE